MGDAISCNQIARAVFEYVRDRVYCINAMKWVISLCVLSILLTVIDGAVHLVETTTTADVLSKLSPEYAGTKQVRRALAAQTVWTLASGWVVLSQIAIIVLITTRTNRPVHPQQTDRMPRRRQVVQPTR